MKCYNYTRLHCYIIVKLTYTNEPYYCPKIFLNPNWDRNRHTKLCSWDKVFNFMGSLHSQGVHCKHCVFPSCMKGKKTYCRPRCKREFIFCLHEHHCRNHDSFYLKNVRIFTQYVSHNRPRLLWGKKRLLFTQSPVITSNLTAPCNLLRFLSIPCNDHPDIYHYM